MKNPLRQRILVTGGAGFLGSHLCERLLDLGCDVLCADNFFTGTKDNITHLMDDHHFEVLRHEGDFNGEPLDWGSESQVVVARPARAGRRSR